MLKDLKFHHIGIACENIDATALQFEGMGYTKSDIVFDPLQNVNICFLSSDSKPCIELLAPVNEASPVVETLKKNGTTPYHLCYSVDDLENTVKNLRKNRFIIVSKPKAAVAIPNSRVAFLFHKDLGLVELVGK